MPFAPRPREPRRTASAWSRLSRSCLGRPPALAQNPAPTPVQPRAAPGGARSRGACRSGSRCPCSRRPAGRADGPDGGAGKGRAVAAGMDEGLRQGSGQQRRDLLHDPRFRLRSGPAGARRRGLRREGRTAAPEDRPLPDAPWPAALSPASASPLTRVSRSRAATRSASRTAALRNRR